MANGFGKKPLFASLKRRPLPIMSPLQAPDSCPLTFRIEISQGIARRCVGNFRVDQKENLRAWRSGALPETARPLTASL
jgi:hypothetical protein